MITENEPLVNGCWLYITSADTAEAIAIGQQLVAQKLAACINILPPITSIYHWEGEIQQATEIAWIAKTTTALANSAIEFIKAHHSYQQPCIIVLPWQSAESGYLKWMQSVLTT
jgi:periplasmic divalent cation tolerance protein